MEKTKKVRVFLCFLMSFVVISSGIVFADIPDGTVVIGDKAYNLKYANDLQNLKEISEAVKSKNGDILIKAHNGVWFDNETAETTTGEFIPELIYKDEQGNVKYFTEEDGEEILLDVIAVGMADNNTLKIKFNKELDKESALNKENYIINGQSLGENDFLEIKDEDTVVLKLHNKNFERKSFDLEVLNNIKDKNQSLLKSKYDSSQIIFSENNEECEKQEIIGDLSLIDSKLNLTSKKIKGNVYVSSENANISDVEIDGILVIETNGKELGTLKNITADQIVVLSQGEKTLKFDNVKANELLSLSKNTVDVELINSSEIKKALIKSSTVIKGEKNSFNEIILASKKADTKVELKGNMNPSVRASNSVNLVSNIEKWEKPLIIKTNTNKAVVNLEGKYSKLQILKECEVNIVKQSIISDSILVNSSANLKMDKDSQVEKVIVNTRKETNKVNIEGKVSNLNIDSKSELGLRNAEIKKLIINIAGAKISSDDKSKVKTLVTNNNEYIVEGKINSDNIVDVDNEENQNGINPGGNVVIPGGDYSIPATGIEFQKTEMEILIGDSFQLEAKIKPSNASNKTIIWISSDENIVTVDESGNIKAVGIGQATVTAMTGNKKYIAKCKITVNPIKVTGIKLSQNIAFLKLNENVVLEADVTPENATNKNIRWTVSNEEVASVENGIVTAKAVGEATVTATTLDGNYTASCRVMVNGVNYEYKVNGNTATFILNDESIANNIVSIKLFDVNNGNLALYDEKQAENGKCEISTELEKGKTYNGTISITGVGKIIVYNFTID